MGVRHKKTRKEKIIADYRHQVYILKNKNIQASIPTATTAAININSYLYVFRDVLRTTILTLSIIVGQLILFFLLKNHIITLLGINY